MEYKTYTVVEATFHHAVPADSEGETPERIDAPGSPIRDILVLMPEGNWSPVGYENWDISTEQLLAMADVKVLSLPTPEPSDTCVTVYRESTQKINLTKAFRHGLDLGPREAGDMTLVRRGTERWAEHRPVPFTVECDTPERAKRLLAFIAEDSDAGARIGN